MVIFDLHTNKYQPFFFTWQHFYMVKDNIALYIILSFVDIYNLLNILECTFYFVSMSSSLVSIFTSLFSFLSSLIGWNKIVFFVVFRYWYLSWWSTGTSRYFSWGKRIILKEPFFVALAFLVPKISNLSNWR